MKATNETPRKRVGFKWYDEPTAESNLPAEPSESTGTENQMVDFAISPAQADLIETINNLSGIIVSEKFAMFAEQQRTAFLIQLMNAVALNAELTAKTTLLLR